MVAARAALTVLTCRGLVHTAIGTETIIGADIKENRIVRGRGWTDLYLCGIATDFCVLKTAIDAFERNLAPWVIADACASHFGPEAHDAGLRMIQRFIGASQIIRTAEVLQRVLSVT